MKKGKFIKKEKQNKQKQLKQNNNCKNNNNNKNNNNSNLLHVEKARNFNNFRQNIYNFRYDTKKS